MRGQRASKSRRGKITESRRLPCRHYRIDLWMAGRKEQLTVERLEGEKSGGFQGERENDKLMVGHSGSTGFPAWWMGGEGESVRSNVEKKSMNSDECSFSESMLQSPGRVVCHHQGSSLGGRPSQVMQRTRRVIDHHNVELKRKGDRDSMEFKCRSGWWSQGKDLVRPYGLDEEFRSLSSTCLSQGV